VEIDIDNLASVFPKRCEASIVVSPSIYVTGTGFGVTWRITYAKVSPPQRTTAADVFRDEIEEEQRGSSAVGTETITEESAPAVEEELGVRKCLFLLLHLLQHLLLQAAGR
jgi:hypothetical protein